MDEIYPELGPCAKDRNMRRTNHNCCATCHHYCAEWDFDRYTNEPDAFWYCALETPNKLPPDESPLDYVESWKLTRAPALPYQMVCDMWQKCTKDNEHEHSD